MPDPRYMAINRVHRVIEELSQEVYQLKSSVEQEEQEIRALKERVAALERERQGAAV